MLVAILAPVGSRTGVPSMIAARAPLGYRGAQLVSGLLYLTNFAWIAINNQIAASACAQVVRRTRQRAHLVRRPRHRRHCIVVARGPRAVGYADRIAVPIMVDRRQRAHVRRADARGTSTRGTRGTRCTSGTCVSWGLDVVIGYQVSWLLMFADYSRYTRSGSAAATAVFAGLALPALWLIPVGWMPRADRRQR